MKNNQNYPNHTDDFIHDRIGLQLIGKRCTIDYFNNKFTGEIIRETKNVIHLETVDKEKILQKSLSIIKITENDKIYVYDGKKLIGRHEDRIKRKIKRKW